MSEKEFGRKYPSEAHRYNDIVGAVSAEDLKSVLTKPDQGELDLTTQGDLDLKDTRKYTNEPLNRDRDDHAKKLKKLRSMGYKMHTDPFQPKPNVKIKKEEVLKEADGKSPKEIADGLIKLSRDAHPDNEASAIANIRNWRLSYVEVLKDPRQTKDHAAAREIIKVLANAIKNPYTDATQSRHGGTALDSANKQAKDKIKKNSEKEKPDELSLTRGLDGKMSIARALSGLIPTVLGLGEDEKIDEFHRGSFTGDKDLPQECGCGHGSDCECGPNCKDCNCGKSEVDEALTGNIAGSIAGAKLGSPGGIPGQLVGGIIGGIAGDKLQDKIDDWGDVDNEELQEIKKLANLVDKTDFSDKEIKMAYGILNDPRYKDGNLTGAIKAIEGIAKGLSEHPGVEKAIYMTQNEPDNLEENIRLGSKGYSVNIDRTGAESALSLTQFKSVWHDEFRDDLTYRDSIDEEMLELKYEEYLERVGIKPIDWPIDDELAETISGGQTFAGDYKTGKAGQWRNTGKTKGRPARVGDLVGAESEGDDDYRHGDTVLINGVWHSLELDKDGQLWATDEDGGSKEFHKGSEDHKDPREDVLEDILRLSGLTKYEYAGTEVFSKYEG